MKKYIFTSILILFIFSFISCNSQENQKVETKQTQETKQVPESKQISETKQIPEIFKIIDEVKGDLDKDGIAEKVIIYNTDIETGLGTERQIYIYKKNNDKWEVWKKSTGAILPSLHGGMMGDPFKEIAIERNCIVIKHFGGSRQKWNYTHRFRYQSSEFQLIGATVDFGSLCDYFFHFDYNLSNGKIIYEKEIQDCENDTSKTENEEMIRKQEALPTMDGFYPGDNELILSDSGTTIYY